MRIYEYTPYCATVPQTIQQSGHLPASEVDWIESADNYVRLWSGGRSRLVREPLSRLEDVLRAEGFVRVHRSALVRAAKIREIRRVRERQH